MATKAVSHDRFRLVGAYERLRRTLLESADNAKLSRSLSYWVLATDRRLPIAFLDRRLRELLELELDELMSTPGVGQKKILGFLDLLRRAARPTPPAEPFGLTSLRSPVPRNAAEAFSASDVSEELWGAWCDTVRRNQLEECPLGRIAPTLQVLPTVIWRKTLGDYVGLSLDELRRLPTHGEKRVAALLEIFCVVHEAISTSVLHPQLDLQITPAFVTPLTKWILEVADRKILPAASEVHARLAAPLIAQIEIDRGAQIAGIVRNRLALEQPISVKLQAEELGVTRARVYQLLDECALCLELRWPEGRWLLAPLATDHCRGDRNALELVTAIRELFFPAPSLLPRPASL
jgi:hypothetical protein